MSELNQRFRTTVDALRNQKKKKEEKKKIHQGLPLKQKLESLIYMLYVVL
jgi:hypothetical protein